MKSKKVIFQLNEVVAVLSNGDEQALQENQHKSHSIKPRPVRRARPIPVPVRSDGAPSDLWHADH